MGNSSCSANSDCQVAGQCCSVEGTCSASQECSLSDGLVQVGGYCSDHLTCATGCCNFMTNECSYLKSFCPEPEQSLAVYIATICALIGLVLVLIGLIVFIKYHQKRLRLKNRIDPRHTSNIPMANPIEGQSVQNQKIPVAKSLKKSQVSFNKILPAPVVNDVVLVNLNIKGEQEYVVAHKVIPITQQSLEH